MSGMTNGEKMVRIQLDRKYCSKTALKNQNHPLNRWFEQTL